MFTIQVHRIQPHVDQHFGPVSGTKSNGMFGIEHHHDLPLDGRHKRSVSRADCKAFTQDLLGEGRIIHL